MNVPSDEIMKLYSNTAEKTREEILNLSSQIRLLTEARDRLLPKLMSGEIAVEGRRPERPLSCQPNGNALGINER